MIKFLILIFCLLFSFPVYANETGTITITGNPVEGLSKYGFILYKDIRTEESPEEIEVWLTEENNWKETLELEYGTYYALIDDTALLPEEIKTPVNCKYVLRFGESPFYETYEISKSTPYAGEEKDKIQLYLISTVSGGPGTPVNSIQEVEELDEVIIGGNQEALETALNKIESFDNELEESKSESIEASIDESIQEKEQIHTEKINFISYILIIIPVILIIVVGFCLYIYKKRMEDD